MEDNDPRISPYILKIIECLHQKKDGHQRELLKILYRMDLSEEQEGVIFDLCMNVWEQVGKTPSVMKKSKTRNKNILKAAILYFLYITGRIDPKYRCIADRSILSYGLPQLF